MSKIRTRNTSKLKFIQVGDDPTDFKIVVNKVTISYPHVFEPWAKNEGDRKRYSGKFLLPYKTHEEEIEILQDFFDDLQKAWFKGKIKPDQLCFKDGDQEAKPDYEDCWFLSASETIKHAPAVIDRDKSKLEESDDKIYGGAIVNVMIRPWKQNNDFGKRINGNLLVVQFHEKGERFGEGAGGGASQADIDEAFEESEVEVEVEELGESDRTRRNRRSRGDDGFED